MASKHLRSEVLRTAAVSMLAASITLVGCGSSPSVTTSKQPVAPTTAQQAVVSSAVISRDLLAGNKPAAATVAQPDPFAHFKQGLKVKDINLGPGDAVIMLLGCTLSGCSPLTPSANGAVVKSGNVSSTDDGQGNYVLHFGSTATGKEQITAMAGNFISATHWLTLSSNGPVYAIDKLWLVGTKAGGTQSTLTIDQITGLTATPASQTIPAGGTTANFTVTATASDGSTLTNPTVNVSTQGGDTVQNADGSYTITLATGATSATATLTAGSATATATASLPPPGPTVTTLAGGFSGSGTCGGVSAGNCNDGTGTTAQFFNPQGLASESNGNLYVADTGNNAIRNVTPAGVVTTIAGQAALNCSSTQVFSGGCFLDGLANVAKFARPSGVAVDGSGNVYVADTWNGRIRKIDGITGNVSTLASGIGLPTCITVDGGGNVYFGGDSGAITKINTSGNKSTLASGFYYPPGITVDTGGNVYVSNGGSISKIDTSGNKSTLATIVSGFGGPQGLAVDSSYNLYAAVTSPGFDGIEKISAGSSVVSVSVYAGGQYGYVDGIGTSAGFVGPVGLALDSSGNLYVSDNNRIRKITPPSS